MISAQDLRNKQVDVNQVDEILENIETIILHKLPPTNHIVFKDLLEQYNYSTQDEVANKLRLLGYSVVLDRECDENNKTACRCIVNW